MRRRLKVSDTLWLKGLHSDHFPLTAMMAYGILRILVEERGLKGVRLVFSDPGGRPTAGLVGLDWCQLIWHLAEHLTNTPPVPDDLLKKDDPKEDPHNSEKNPKKATPSLKKALPKLVQEGNSKGNSRARAFAPSLYLPSSAGPFITPLDTTKGRQSLLRILEQAYTMTVRLGQSLDDHLVRILCNSPLLYPKETLPRGFGKEYRIGWHPSQYRRWAEQAREPNKEKVHETVRIHPVAILLAWEALPLFTLYPGTRGPMGAGLWEAGSPNPSLLLPIPGVPVSLAELRVLLFQGPLARASGNMARYPWPPGVALWESIRLGGWDSKDPYPVFSDAEVWWGG